MEPVKELSGPVLESTTSMSADGHRVVCFRASSLQAGLFVPVPPPKQEEKVTFASTPEPTMAYQHPPNIPLCVECGVDYTTSGIHRKIMEGSCGHLKCFRCTLKSPRGCLQCTGESSLAFSLQSGLSGVKTRAQRHASNSTAASKVPKCKDVATAPVIKRRPGRPRKKPIQPVKVKVKPFFCPQCKKEFITPTEVKNHLVVHSDERPFACKICEKRFKRRKSLKVHMRLHSG